MSVFLMGVYDEHTKSWRTVTKCHGGFDDALLEKLQKQLDMTKISKDYDKVPKWLRCSRNLAPDFVTNDPKVGHSLLKIHLALHWICKSLCITILITVLELNFILNISL